MTNGIEKREYTRIKVRWPITVVTDDSAIEGETRDIAVNGVHICSEEPLRLNEAFHMSITPPDRENTYGTGFCFVKVSDEDSHLLRDVLSVYYP